MTSRKIDIHERRDDQKRKTWINNVIRVMKYTREKAEKEYDKIFKKQNNV